MIKTSNNEYLESDGLRCMKTPENKYIIQQQNVFRWVLHCILLQTQEDY